MIKQYLVEAILVGSLTWAVLCAFSLYFDIKEIIAEYKFQKGLRI